MLHEFSVQYERDSKFAGPFTFAWSSFTAFFVALVCDLMITPAMIMVFKPFGKEE